MAEKIKTEFKGGKKIVTFPDGKIKEIKKQEVEAYKQHLVNQKTNIDRQLSRVDEDLGDMEKSKQVIVE
jgi:ribosomal protein L44E